MSVFAARLIIRRVDKSLVALHSHLSHMKASLRLDALMNQDQLLAELTTIKTGVAGLVQSNADLAAEVASLKAAALVPAETTPDVDAELSAISALIPVAAPAPAAS